MLTPLRRLCILRSHLSGSTQSGSFLRFDPEQAIAILRVLEIKDATQEIAEEADSVDQESKEAGEQLRKRRPNMNFEEMGIPVGSTLHYTQGDQTVTVVGPKKVRLGEEELSLTAATRMISQVDYDQPPALYWTFKGQSVAGNLRGTLRFTGMRRSRSKRSTEPLPSITADTIDRLAITPEKAENRSSDA